MHKKLIYCVIALMTTVTISSCSKYNKILKGENWEEKHAYANELYEKKKFYKASTLFEQMFPVFVGKPDGKEIHLKYAYSLYYDGEFDDAGDAFIDFVTTYNRSEEKQEAFYMYIKSLYMYTPPYYLDQSNTKYTIKTMQDFLNSFPKSEFFGEVSEMQEVLNQQLVDKAFVNARQYYKIQSFQSAVVYLDNFQQDFPDAEYVEEAFYWMFMAQFQLGEKSIDIKKKSRYEKAVEFFQAFNEKYPSSKFLKEMDVAYKTSLKELDKINEILLFQAFEKNYTISQQLDESVRKKALEETISVYTDLKTKFPNSKYIKQIQKRHEKALQQFNALK